MAPFRTQVVQAVAIFGLCELHRVWRCTTHLLGAGKALVSLGLGFGFSHRFGEATGRKLSIAPSSQKAVEDANSVSWRLTVCSFAFLKAFAVLQTHAKATRKGHPRCSSGWCKYRKPQELFMFEIGG